jgi:hypothetical protein
MIGKGIFEREISTGKVGLKFGTYAAGISEREYGKNISSLFEDMNTGKSSVFSLLCYFYGGAVAYANHQGQPAPSIDQVGDWIEELGVEEATKIFLASLEQPKNSKAPEKAGHIQSATS